MEKIEESQDRVDAIEPVRHSQVLRRGTSCTVSAAFSLRHIEPVNIKVQDLHVAVDPAVSLRPNIFRSFKRRFSRQDAVLENTPKPLLVGVSAEMPAGSLTAIIGASGSGKTTLLNIISQRVSGKNIATRGKISFNGVETQQSIRIGYVMQQDILLPTLTVRETLEYAADLRLPNSTDEERKTAVDNVISGLGLGECAGTRIGSRFEKGCSGGEKRRISISVQILANPSVLCCDEPTTGLDAYSALKVVQHLKMLAEHGRTVIMSIHAPRSEIWALLDRVVLLSRGYTLYSGAADNTVSYFNGLGFVKPPLVNPAEFLIDVASIDDRSDSKEKESYDRLELLKEAWKKKSQSIRAKQSPQKMAHCNSTKTGDVVVIVEGPSSRRSEVKEDALPRSYPLPDFSHLRSTSGSPSTLSLFDTGASKDTTPWGTISIIRPTKNADFYPGIIYSRRTAKVGFRRQLTTLTMRSFRVTLRDPLGVVGSLVEVLFISLVSGWIFYQLGDDLAGIRSRLGALYSAAVFQGFVVFTIEIYRLTEEIPVFDREHSEGVVDVFSFLLSRQVSRLFLENLPIPCIFSVIFYFMCGFRAVAQVFFIFLAVQIIVHYTAITLAMVCVAVSRHLEGATLIGNIAYIVQTFCSGFFIQADQIAVYMRWMKWISFTFYTFGALVSNEFVGVDQGIHGEILACPYSSDPSDPRCMQYTGKYILQSLNFPSNWLWRPLVIIICFPTVFFLGAALILTLWRIDITVTGELKKTQEERTTDLEMMPHAQREKVQSIQVDLREYSVVLHKRNLVRGRSHKVILHPVTATFQPGCINVILGPSGSGKTTLLQSLSDRLDNGFLNQYRISGDITLNHNIPYFTRGLCSITSFVSQDDDNLMPSLTVRETLRFAASLRLPASMSKSDKFRRVEEVILKMGLKNCADRLIGNDLRKGISGGEKRRVSIATQILKNPRIVLLDEPTSGLDTFTASSVFEVLRSLADEGRTILLTIHQPRSDLFKSFRNVLVLARGGHVVYSGPGKDVLPYYSRVFGLNCPLDTSPADFVLDNVAADPDDSQFGDANRKQVERIINNWHGSIMPELNLQNSGNATEEELNGYKRVMNPFRATLPIVMQRSALNMWRNLNLVITRNGQTVGLGIIYTLFFAPLQDNQAAIQSRIGFIQQITSLYFVGMLQNLSVFPAELSLYRREHAETCYSPSTFLFSYTLLETPFTLLSSLIFGLLAAYASNLGRGPPTVALVTALNCFSIVSCGESLGIIFCTLLSSHTGFALTVTSTFIAISANMSGVLSIHLPTFLAAVNWLNPCRYAVESLAAYALKGRTFSCDLAQEVGGRCPIETGEEVLALYGFSERGWPFLLGAVGCALAYRLLAYMVLVLKVRQR